MQMQTRVTARLRGIVGALILLVVVATWTTMASASTSSATLVDTLGEASPTDTFSVFGSGGASIAADILAGPKFDLERPIVITEIGGFVNNCAAIFMGVPLCPETSPFVVRVVQPSADGSPDNEAPLAVLTLSHDDDPLRNSYEFVQPDLLLGTGTYFALFGAQNEDSGWLMAGAGSYQAGAAPLGFWQPGWAYVVSYPGAVRVLGRPATPLELLADLTASVDALALGRLGSSLHDKLVTVERMLEANKSRQACAALESFTNQVEAQTDKGLTIEQAAELERKGADLAAAIGC